MPDTSAAQPADTPPPSGSASPAPATDRSSWHWLGPAFCALIGASMLCLTWNAWPDVLIDSGRESYVAWRLAEGDVLYRDVMVFNGPLSPYVNAMWMKLLGPSLRSLEIGNTLVILAVAASIYRGTCYLSGHGTATIATAVFLSVFAFGNLSMMDSCSFMFPYSHEMTHGALLLLVLLMWIAMKQRRVEGDTRGRVALDALTGVTLGMVFLTKVELFVAGGAAVIVAIALDALAGRGRVGRALLSVAITALCAAVPSLIAWALLARHMPAGDALHGLLGSWNHIGNRELTGMLYFRVWMGMLDPRSKLLLMAQWGFVWGLIVLVAVLVSSLGRRAGATASDAVATIGRLIITAVSIAIVIAVVKAGPRGFWLDVVAPLPIALVLIGACACRAWWRARGGDGAARWAFACVAVALSMVMLLKLGLWPRVWHYGFVLALPGVVMVVVAFVGWLPAWVARRGGRGGLCRTIAIQVIAVFMVAHVVRINAAVNEKPVWVGSGGDTIRADGRGGAVRKFLEEFDKVAPRDATLAVLPEGAMLNYLSRRRNPTPYVFSLPSDLAMFGESRVLESYERNPPDFIVLAHRNTREYGREFFGSDYAQPFMAWLRRDYGPVGLIGDQPLRSEKFGLLVLRRKAGAPQR